MYISLILLCISLCMYRCKLDKEEEGRIKQRKLVSENVSKEDFSKSF
jgi:hypothetical protein